MSWWPQSPYFPHGMVALSLPTGYNRWSSPPNLDSNCLISSCEATVYQRPILDGSVQFFLQLRSTKTPSLSKHIMSCISGTSLKISMQQPDKQTFQPTSSTLQIGLLVSFVCTVSCCHGKGHFFRFTDSIYSKTWLPTLGDFLNLATFSNF